MWGNVTAQPIARKKDKEKKERRKKMQGWFGDKQSGLLGYCWILERSIDSKKSDKRTAGGRNSRGRVKFMGCN